MLYSVLSFKNTSISNFFDHLFMFNTIFSQNLYQYS